jgi:hypothetical protein
MECSLRRVFHSHNRSSNKLECFLDENVLTYIKFALLIRSLPKDKCPVKHSFKLEIAFKGLIKVEMYIEIS